MTNVIETIAKATCRSGKFETGEGTCALRCLDILGDARAGPHGCPHASQIHGNLAAAILSSLTQSGYVIVPREATPEMCNAYCRLEDEQGVSGLVSDEAWSAMLTAALQHPVDGEG